MGIKGTIVASGDRRPREAMAEHSPSEDDRRRAWEFAQESLGERVYDTLPARPVNEVWGAPEDVIYLGVFGATRVAAGRAAYDHPLSDPQTGVFVSLTINSVSDFVWFAYSDWVTPRFREVMMSDERVDADGDPLPFEEGLWHPSAPGDEPPVSWWSFANEALRWVVGDPGEGAREASDLTPERKRLYGFRLVPQGRQRAEFVRPDGLLRVQLPKPDALADELRAAFDTVVDADELHVRGAGSDAVWLAWREDGTALLLVFNEDDDVGTYFRQWAIALGEPETDLLAGAPAWWDEILHERYHGLWGERVEREAFYVTAIYGYDADGWARAVGCPDETNLLRALRAPAAGEAASSTDAAPPAPRAAVGTVGLRVTWQAVAMLVLSVAATVWLQGTARQAAAPWGTLAAWGAMLAGVVVSALVTVVVLLKTQR